jgi:hypothetical protein
VDLKPEPLPPPASQQRLEELCHEIDRIAGLLADRAEDAHEAIRTFNTVTGHDYTAYAFTEYWRSRDPEDFAREAARPARPRVSDITRDELVESSAESSQPTRRSTTSCHSSKRTCSTPESRTCSSIPRTTSKTHLRKRSSTRP